MKPAWSQGVYDTPAAAAPALWLTDAALARLSPGLWDALQRRGPTVVLSTHRADAPPDGPAVLVLTPEDMLGAERAGLLGLLARAAPGRPVVVGGAQDRGWLLEAINVWRACGWLMESAADDLILDALARARRACELQISLTEASAALGEDCRRLDGVMAELRRTRVRLLHAERLTTIGQVTDTLADRLREVFAALKDFERHVLRPEADEELKEVLGCAVEGIEGLGTLLDDLVALGQRRDQVPDLRDEDLDALVERSLRLFQTDRGAADRVLRLRANSGARVRVDPPRLQLVLLNLLRNAVEATSPGDRIELRTHCDGERAVVEIEDEGCGMSAEELARCFTPFSTSKGPQGLGLGLGISRAAVRRQGGQLLARSLRGEGSVFSLVLPVAPGPAVAARPGDPRAWASAPGSRREEEP